VIPSIATAISGGAAANPHSSFDVEDEHEKPI
jgi:hypothetical protein